MVTFTSWDIGQYVYSNYLLSSLWRHKFWNWALLSDEAFFFPIKKQGKKYNYLKNENSF